MWEYFFGETEIVPDKKQIRLRHLLHKQIRDSNLGKILLPGPLKLVRQNAMIGRQAGPPLRAIPVVIAGTPFTISKKVRFTSKRVKHKSYKEALV